MLLGYNTNGLAHHRLLDAIDLLADLGYASIAITLDVGALDPYVAPARLETELSQVRERLAARGMRSVIETGARFLLNPRLKHDPTLMDPDPTRRAVRVDFLARALRIAKTLGSDALSFWSGALTEPIPPARAFDRLVSGIEPLLNAAREAGITLAFEPEPGMWIDTFEQFAILDDRIRDSRFQLTVDIGHVHCIEHGDIGAHLARWGPRIRNIHVEDMNRGVHEHLAFGEGTLDFDSAFAGLRTVGYTGPVHVELSRDSHRGAAMAAAAGEFLRPWFQTPLPKSDAIPHE
jgi:sugar phosphate isomerase/epimerase